MKLTVLYTTTEHYWCARQNKKNIKLFITRLVCRHVSRQPALSNVSTVFPFPTPLEALIRKKQPNVHSE